MRCAMSATDPRAQCQRHRSYHRAGDVPHSRTGCTLPSGTRRQGEIQSALGAKHRADAERLRASAGIEQAITQHALGSAYGAGTTGCLGNRVAEAG